MSTHAIPEGLAVLLPLVWDRGIKTRAASHGNPETAEPAYIICESVEDAAELTAHIAHCTDYTLGDNVAMTIVHPTDDILGQPLGKVNWLPEFTTTIVKKWVC